MFDARPYMFMRLSTPAASGNLPEQRKGPLSSFYDRAGDLMRWIFDHRVEGPPVLDMNRYFPDGWKFVGAWPQIRAEALAVAERLNQVPRFHEIMKEQADISNSDGRDWRLFVLKAYGVENSKNTVQCPVLSSMAEASADVLSVCISFLGPGKHVPAHRGPFRGVLRFSLALSVPKAADGTSGCLMKIDNKEYRLADGEFLLWDDTFPHEVWNYSDNVRAVLQLDVRRRDLPVDMRILSRIVMFVFRIGIRARGIA
jgi:aspartate beta-hydroxylase